MIELLDVLRPDGEIGALRQWQRCWFAADEGNGRVISTWQELQTDEELAALSQRVAASALTRPVRLEARDFGDPTVDAITAAPPLGLHRHAEGRPDEPGTAARTAAASAVAFTSADILYCARPSPTPAEKGR